MTTQAEIAEHLDLGERQVRNLIRDGVLPRADGRSQLDLNSFRVSYIRHLRDQGSHSRASSALDKERVRLARAQATRAERENVQKAGELMPISEHTDFVCDLASEFVRSLSALPGRLAGELAATSSASIVRARLLDEVATIRDALAKRCGDNADRVTEVREAASEAETSE